MSDHPPKPLGDTMTHYFLASSMAKAAGVDLVAEMAAGRLSHQDWAQMVQKCRGCDWEREGGGCARWLALQVPGEANVPRSCENQPRFAALAGE